MKETRRHATYILAVDDEAGQLELIKAAIEPEGFRVVTAGSCAEARKLLSEGSYEILLVDLRLPDGDGIDLLTLAREKDPETVAVVLTAHSSTKTAVDALHHGAYDYLIKPCPPKLLAAAVCRAAERHRLARTLAERTAELEAVNQGLHLRVSDATREIYLLNERLKRYVAELTESNEGRVRFMETLAHELKNPLSVVHGYASFFLHRPLQDWSAEELSNASQAIFRSTEFLQSLLDELMQATKVSQHKIVLRREPLPIFDEARIIAESFHAQAKEKQISLAFYGGEGPGPAVEADRMRLRQILSNLIANAIKFTPEGGRVAVRVRPSADGVQIAVEDTGVGIPQKNIDRIFDRFYQTETAARHKGLGLGLEIAKGLVMLHGGKIWAESAPGTGSRFHFTLPFHAPKDIPVSETTPAPKGPATQITESFGGPSPSAPLENFGDLTAPKTQ